MFIKIVGNVLVLISGFLIGYYYASKDLFRMKELRQIRKAMEILKSEICFASVPLKEAFLNIAERVDTPLSAVFLEASQKLEGSYEGAGQVWKKAFEKQKAALYLDKEDYENIFSFGKTLGYLDKGMQVSNISMLCAYIDEKTAELNVTAQKNKRLYLSLGVLSGLLVCVILL